MTVDLGILALRRRGLPYVRLNTEVQVPALHLQDGQLTLGGLAGVDICAIRSVWYRRPIFNRGHRTLPAVEQNFVEDEQRATWFDTFEALRGVPWFNWPDDNRRAQRRMTMLRLAAQSGLRTPISLVTRDALAAQAFVRAVGSSVVKSVGAGFRDDEQGRAAFAHLVQNVRDVPKDLGDAPVLLQAFVSKRADWRVTVFGPTILSVRIHSQEEPSAQVDWRQSEHPLRLERVTLPDQVAQAIRGFMVQTNLRFGAFDFVEDLSGGLWFLEVNPNGQWGWMEQEAGVPLSDALAEALWSAQPA
ncbi:hypothetical protein ACFFLM_08180 [Deinococcus oregonensis]|uniref:ATP-grasp ribosomal peptide maturase n=1 Tax=Deinococcus oregonensis TaxID=1805970 RepID=A0ABV6AWQ8_9DEIO